MIFDDLISIITIISCVLIVLTNVAFFVYKKIKKLPIGECSYCAKPVSKRLKEYRKFVSKKPNKY